MPTTFLDRQGRPCPDPDALRERYAVRGCATFVKPVDATENLSCFAALLLVEEGGDLMIIVNSAEPEGGQLGALAYLHKAISDPEGSDVPWSPIGDGRWMLPFVWLHSSERGGQVIDQLIAFQGGRPHSGARCLSSTRAGTRCTRRGGWISTGFCWQHVPEAAERAFLGRLSR